MNYIYTSIDQTTVCTQRTKHKKGPRISAGPLFQCSCSA